MNIRSAWRVAYKVIRCTAGELPGCYRQLSTRRQDVYLKAQRAYWMRQSRDPLLRKHVDLIERRLNATKPWGACNNWMKGYTNV